MLIPGPDLQGCRHLAPGNVEKRPIRELGRKPCGDFAEGDGATVGGSRSAPVSACYAIGRPASCLVPSLFS